MILGCSSHDAAAPHSRTIPSTAATRAELFRSAQHVCTLPAPTNPGRLEDRDEVFTELILLAGPSATLSAARVADLTTLAADPSLEVLAAPHVMAHLGQRAELTLVDRIGATREASLHQLRVLPREASDGAVVLELQATFQLPNPSGAVPAATATVTLTTTGAEQQLLLTTTALPHAQGRTLLALLKYWRIHAEQDLRAIFECKMRERQKALSRH
jgi:hypothetical protein